ncbi:hypothetical protein [Desulfovibrio legallii]|jgi:hypothetical protein|uniref:Response regulatory domain-containing protein n=1 Tax=Desulfovibrio legallii TaxID=571438 RepID=A0A1G7Q4W5_9BACT|nr:hypothetical protein [Desulfovibrio legallii]SDF93627.1 hypothetical protein SAMN05192586_11929 [Desulfovibrio legallii]
MRRNLVVQTRRPADLAAFVAGLETPGHNVVLVSGLDDCKALLRTQPPDLMILDPEPGTDARRAVTDLLLVNAAVPTAVASPLPAAEFHESTEGLGILTALPQTPDAADAARLLQLLDALN